MIGHGAIRGVRRVGVYLHPLGAVVLLLAGGYVVYYWLTIGGILFALGELGAMGLLASQTAAARAWPPGH